MPELAYFLEQNTAAMLQAKNGNDLSQLLQREKHLTTKCGRAILQRLSTPPCSDNVESIAVRMRELQRVHDACGRAVKRPVAVSDAEWEAFQTQWAEIPVLDMNVLCEYCAESGREIRKRIRAGKDDAQTVWHRVRAICELGRIMPHIATSDRRAMLDFYQQGILDLRRLRTAMRETGMDASGLDEPLIILEREKQLLRG